MAEKAFSYHEIQRESEYRMRNDKPKDYCWRISNKIAHYIQKIHNFDVLRMDVDFFIDEHKRIWLVHIDNVVIRNNELSSMTKILRGIKLKGLEVIKKIKDKMIEDNLVLNDDEFNRKLNAYRQLEEKKYAINNQFRQTLKSQEKLTRKLLKLDALKKLYAGGKMKKEFDKSKVGSSMDI